MILGLEFPPISHLFEWRDMAFGGDNPFVTFNKVVLQMIIASVIVCAFFIVGGRRRALVPSGVQNAAEVSYEFIDRGIAREVMNPARSAKFVPFLTALFFFILVNNIFAVIPPFIFPATSRMAIPAYLALQTWVIFIAVGIRSQGLAYFKNALFPPGVPWALYPLVAPIELISTFFVRPFSLAVRLFANLYAGHLLIAVFLILTYTMATATSDNFLFLFVLPFPALMAFAIFFFEILVSVLQAYIFTILTAVYIGEAMEAHH